MQKTNQQDFRVEKVIKKKEYDELVKNVNAIDTSQLVKKTDYNAKTKDKIPNLATTTTTALNDVKNNIPDVSTLVRKPES